MRRAIVLRALLWLIANNRYYSDVTIDMSTLEILPIDGQLTNFLSVSSTEMEQSLEIHDQRSCPQSTFLATSARTITEQQTIQQSIFDPQYSHQHVNWPSLGSPINEFTTEGYICSAFPTLFPQGNAACSLTCFRVLPSND